jgi:ABC-2 type transport system ATP-binding protein
MRQRVKLAMALVHSPRLAFLDEPTNGLDPAGRRKMLDLVLKVRVELGTSVILASHLLEDVERVSDQLVILDKGEVKAHGRMADLRRILSRRFELRFLEPLSGEQETDLVQIGTLLDAMNGVYDLELNEADATLPFRWAEHSGAVLVQVTPRFDRLDEILIRAIRGSSA